MTKNELYQAAQELAEITIKECPEELYQRLRIHAEINWSIDINGMIRLAFESAFGVNNN